MAIKKLTSDGESEMLEFKKSTSELKEGGISIAAILNKHRKGTLYFGIKNEGTVTGQEISEKTLRDVSKSISDSIEPKIYPEISKVHIEGKSCVEVQFHGSSVPYFAFGRAYIGVSDEDRQLSAKEIERLKREEIPEIPVRAIREALVNSFCHRNYYAPESNKIAIFKNRVEIWNPGTFPEGLTPEDFITGEEQSILRNPLIAEILYKSKEIERWGSGLKRIYEECSAGNVKVEFKDLKTGFLVVFYRLEGTTPKTEDEILLLIRQNPGITKEEIAGHLNITLDGVKYHIRKLTKEGIISWKGPTKGGHWEIQPDE